MFILKMCNTFSQSSCSSILNKEGLYGHVALQLGNTTNNPVSNALQAILHLFKVN